MIVSVLLCMWLFLFGVLAIAGYWRLSRRQDEQARQTAACEQRTEDRAASLEASVDRLQVALLAQRKETETRRITALETDLKTLRGELEDLREQMMQSGQDEDATQVYQSRTTLVSIAAAGRIAPDSVVR